MTFYIKNLKFELFISNLSIFLLTTFAVVDAQDTQGSQSTGEQDSQPTENACSSESEFDSSTYNLGLHIGALFIILCTSSLGKLFVLLIFIINILHDSSFLLFFLTF